MSGSYAVDLDELAAVLDRMGACQAALLELADDVEVEVGGLHGEWSGRAREAHALRHAAWSQTFAQMREALATMQAAGRTAHDSYAAASGANLAMWRQVR